MIKDYFEDYNQDIPVFIAGDFNEVPSNEPIRDIMGSAFSDLFTVMQNQKEYSSPEKFQS
jgi:predicted extracellular nuclease